MFTYSFEQYFIPTLVITYMEKQLQTWQKIKFSDGKSFGVGVAFGEFRKTLTIIFISVSFSHIIFTVHYSITLQIPSK